MFSDFFGGVSVSLDAKHENSTKNSGEIRSKLRRKLRGENSKKNWGIFILQLVNLLLV